MPSREVVPTENLSLRRASHEGMAVEFGRERRTPFYTSAQKAMEGAVTCNVLGPQDASAFANAA